MIDESGHDDTMRDCPDAKSLIMKTDSSSKYCSSMIRTRIEEEERSHPPCIQPYRRKERKFHAAASSAWHVGRGRAEPVLLGTLGSQLHVRDRPKYSKSSESKQS